MTLCKHCGSDTLVKDGLVKGKQRYLCKSCHKTFRVGDDRERYSIESRIKVVKLYTEGLGLRAIERLENIPSSLLVHWIRGFSRMIREKLCTTAIPEDAKEVEILEVGELFTYYQKKTKKAYVWLAVDRNRNKIINITVSKKRDKSVFVRIAQRLERKDFKVKILCSDGYEGCRYYKLAQKHIVTKAETSLVESKNSLIRHYLARFNRKTKRYSKAFDMIFASLAILFNKSLLLSILI
jgi:insertion element IS1 protein InsB